MIQQKTNLAVSDNSGAKRIKCLKVLGGFRRKTAKIGDVIVAAVTQLRQTNKYNSKVLRGSVVRALVIKTKHKYEKKDGSYFKMDNNLAVLLNKRGNLIGTRVLTPLPRLLKNKRNLKFFSLCRGTV